MRRRKDIDWRRLALIHELEGTKPAVETVPLVRRHKGKEYRYRVRRIRHLDIVSQDIARIEIPQQVCKEMQEAGFKARVKTDGRWTRCSLERANEILCAANRMLPHYISEDTKRRVKGFLEEAEQLKPRRPRIPFKCPE